MTTTSRREFIAGAAATVATAAGVPAGDVGAADLLAAVRIATDLPVTQVPAQTREEQVAEFARLFPRLTPEGQEAITDLLRAYKRIQDLLEESGQAETT